MPKIDFLGKGDIAGHHLATPFHDLKMDKKKSVGEPSIDGNLIIHGDNLLALKALLPRYAGRIKCIYIDPPYNTGNEGWVYNDKVNSPLIKDWHKKTVDRDDQCRHDKWLCMMWPRLQLLRELLADDGVIFISCDDNEQHRLRAIMDEIFGEDNFISTLIHQRAKGGGQAKYVVKGHDYIHIYTKNLNEKITLRRKKIFQNKIIEKNNKKYLINDDVIRKSFGKYEGERRCFYEDILIYKNEETKQKIDKGIKDGRYFLKKHGKDKHIVCEYIPLEEASSKLYSIMKFLSEEGKKELENLSVKGFDYPKPLDLVKQIIESVTLNSKKSDIILDSFSGSGTTAHAVLALNKEDGGNRKFILVECEDYADKITAERVRRVIKGVPQAKDENLKKGLGGSFTFATLGDEIDPEKILSGEAMPDWETLARHVFWLATGTTLTTKPKANKTGLVGRHKSDIIYLLYQPDIKFMQSDKAILTGTMADALGAKRKKGERIIYYAAGAYVSQNDMKKSGIVFCQLPWAITKRIAGKT